MYQIMRFYHKKYKHLTLKQALDLFCCIVETYKGSKNSKEKLHCTADAFLISCIIADKDFLTGAQSFEVANNLATDLGTNKDLIMKEIKKTIKKERMSYEKTRCFSILYRFVQLCKRIFGKRNHRR